MRGWSFKMGFLFVFVLLDVGLVWLLAWLVEQVHLGGWFFYLVGLLVLFVFNVLSLQKCNKCLFP